MTDMIRKDSAEEICAHRDRALDLYRRAVELIAEANKAARKATLSQHAYGFGPSRKVMQSLGSRPDEGSVEDIRKELDRYVWRHLFDSTGLGDLFDTKRKRKFDDQLERDPPEVSVETLMATAFDLASRAPEIIEESICDLFNSLRKSFKSNSGSGFGRRLILTHAMDNGYLSYSWGDERVGDFERAVCLVRGEEVPDRMGGIRGCIREAAKQNDSETFHGVIEARWYKNGNLHLWVKDDDTIRRLNDILAKHGELKLTA